MEKLGMKSVVAARLMLAAAFVVLSTVPAMAGPTAAQKCEAGKNAAAGVYFNCLSTAQKSLIRTGDAAKYAAAVGKCEQKLDTAWQKLEDGAGALCPSVGDLSAVKQLLVGCNGGVAEAASGGTPPPDPQTCAADLATCNGDLASCEAGPGQTHSIGGTVSGLEGFSLGLRNDGGDDLPIAADGTFTFPTQLPTGATYAITVQSQPTSPSQTCAVSNGVGTIGTADVTSVTIQCVTNTYTIGGIVHALSSGTLRLRNNGADEIGLVANGSFTFLQPIASGSSYSVTIAGQPSGGQTCRVVKGLGYVDASNVTGVFVNCSTDYVVAGDTTGLASGKSVTIVNNGGDQLVVGGNGSFAFPSPMNNGQTYSVTVKTQPVGQTCTVSNGSGTISNIDVVNVAINCTSHP